MNEHEYVDVEAEVTVGKEMEIAGKGLAIWGFFPRIRETFSAFDLYSLCKIIVA